MPGPNDTGKIGNVLLCIKVKDLISLNWKRNDEVCDATTDAITFCRW